MRRRWPEGGVRLAVRAVVVVFLGRQFHLFQFTRAEQGTGIEDESAQLGHVQMARATVRRVGHHVLLHQAARDAFQGGPLSSVRDCIHDRIPS